MNASVDDSASLERICFQIEEAQWYYEDFVRPLDPDLPSMSLRLFCERMFMHCPTLSSFGVSGGKAYETFMMYKNRVPVRGAILLNDTMDSVVLVKGWKKGANWSFPRGKINKDEDDLVCATREVYEETGYDLEESGLIPLDRDVKHIDVNLHEQQLRMFVFRNVPMDTIFEPKTRKEISRVDWWALSDLPAFRKKNKHDQSQNTVKPNQFYMVAPFLAPLRRWVIEQKKRDAQRPQVPIPQHHPGGMNHNDLLTDEDHGPESHEPSYTDAEISEFDQDQVLDTTATINRLFRIQPRPEDLIAAAPTPPPPSHPVAKNTGEALLALLHSNPEPTRTHQSPPRNMPLHTPLDQTIEQPSMPRNPHHQYQHPRPPPFPNMPPPPAFPQMAGQNNSFSYEQLGVHNVQQRNGFRQRPMPQHEHNPRNQGPHPYQPQHLIHPQPLPPHVQRAVFTGGPVHPPMVPPPIQQQPVAQFSAPVSITVPNPQFPGLHAPMVPPVQKQSPPKLTSHSLALLNAFKSRDQANNAPVGSVSSDLSLRESGLPPVHSRRSQPHELPGIVPQQGPPAPYNQQSIQPGPQSTQMMDPNVFTARPPISENQRSTLLGLFKSPTTTNALPVQSASATALPTSTTPSAVELSAVEPLSENAASTSALLNDRRKPSEEVKNAPIPEMNPELNLPFRARAILARPSELNEQEPSRPNGARMKPQARSNSKRSPPTMPSPATMDSSPKKPFQPQILKRPQSGSPQITGATTPTQTSYATFTRPLPEPPAMQSQVRGHVQPLLDRQALPQPPEHKQALLSLFGKPAMTDSLPIPHSSSIDPFAAMMSTGSTSARTRVDSLASDDTVSRRGSGAPISPADKGFLLSYLENVVKGA